MTKLIVSLILLPALLGLTLGSPLPQEKAASPLGDGPDYFGGIYIGDGNREDVEPVNDDDDEYGEYFGGIYVGNGGAARSDPGPAAAPAVVQKTSAQQNQPDIFGGIGSILQGLFGLVSGAVEGVAKVAGDPHIKQKIAGALNFGRDVTLGALEFGGALAEGAITTAPRIVKAKAEDVQKNVGDLATGVLEVGGKVIDEVVKNAPAAIERSGQVVNGIIKAKQESRPFVEQRLQELSSMGQLVGTFVQSFGKVIADNTEDFLQTFDRRVKCHSDCPQMAEGSEDRAKCERRYCEGFDRTSFEFDKAKQRENEVDTV